MMTDLPSYLLSPFLPMISDYGFKVTFGNEKNTTFLKRSLQALIKSEVPITEVEFYKNTIEGIVKDDRSGILDLACKDVNGNHFIVEMQLDADFFFFQRLKFYGFHKFLTLTRRGKDFVFRDIPKIYVIGFLGENINPYADYHQVGGIRNEKGELMDDQIKFITVELNKFTVSLEQISTDLEKLVYTMKMAHVVTKPIEYPRFWTEDWIKIALDELATRNLTPDERFAVDRTMAINSEFLRRQRDKLDEAEAKGIEKGIKKGVEEGKVIGIEEGIVIGEERIKTKADEDTKNRIKQILRLGKMTVEEIALTFDKLVEEIQQIKNELDDESAN